MSSSITTFSIWADSYVQYSFRKQQKQQQQQQKTMALLWQTKHYIVKLGVYEDNDNALLFWNGIMDIVLMLMKTPYELLL